MTFRALYHIVMGIAIIKEQNWGRMWFLWLQLVELGLGMFSIDLIDGARAVLFLIFLFLLTRPRISAVYGTGKSSPEIYISQFIQTTANHYI